MGGDSLTLVVIRSLSALSIRVKCDNSRRIGARSLVRSALQRSMFEFYNDNLRRKPGTHNPSDPWTSAVSMRCGVPKARLGLLDSRAHPLSSVLKINQKHPYRAPVPYDVDLLGIVLGWLTWHDVSGGESSPRLVFACRIHQTRQQRWPHEGGSVAWCGKHSTAWIRGTSAESPPNTRAPRHAHEADPDPLANSPTR